MAAKRAMELNRPAETFYGLNEQERIGMTRAAFAAGVPLMVRWANMPSETCDRWYKRAVLAAKFLEHAGSVVDVGCGAMVLEEYLKKNQKYIPVDLATRDHRTIVIDLNKGDELRNLPHADAVAVLGTLEYIYNLEQLLSSLRRYPLIVTSFNVRLDDQLISKREANGWVVHLNIKQLIKAFGDSKFQLLHQEPLEFNEHLLVFS